LASDLNLELVTKLSVCFDRQKETCHKYLLYKALPIQVAIIRATTADSLGNLSLEHESLFCDQKIMAMAARNSGGLVLAQVKRLSTDHGIPTRSVHIPGALVDCVVVVDENEHDSYHPMSYDTRYDPVLTNEIRAPKDTINRIALDHRIIIARRACFVLKPNNIVNLGIGLPESVAAVASEEGMLDYATLTTEPGVFGGTPLGGRNFGPSANADALMAMNEMFDYYDGGGLDIAFLGAGQISSRGDVNVSRLSQHMLTGPGGFIDISQNTRNLCFLATFTAKGLEIALNCRNEMEIVSEGRIKKFVSQVNEKTFSGDEAVRRGQKVYYVTERAVFRRTSAFSTLELVEIAPGVRLKEDILDQMDFYPIISPDLKVMDPRIFIDTKMNITLFGSLNERISYIEEDHAIYINNFGISINSDGDVEWFFKGLENILKPLVTAKGPIDVIVNYDGFDVAAAFHDSFRAELTSLEKNYYKSAKRFAGKAFYRSSLAKKVNIKTWDESAFFMFDKDKDGIISPQELRDEMRSILGISLTPFQINEICTTEINKHNFVECIQKLLLS